MKCHLPLVFVISTQDIKEHNQHIMDLQMHELQRKIRANEIISYYIQIIIYQRKYILGK